MKPVIFLFAVIAVACAAPVSSDKDAVVVRSSLDNIGVEGYKFGYETSNGIAADETGEVRNIGAEDEYIAVQGSFKYLGPDGVTYTVTYVADENGFQPQGDHLPSL